MPKVESQCLVIDASVARSAGGKEATHSHSKCCRDFLTAVYRICHRVVMTADLKEEWDRHRSSFARQWLLAMISRRKLLAVRVDAGPAAEFARTAFPVIQDAALSQKQREKIAKDVRLIEAAIATNCRVVSCDEEMRALLGGLSGDLPQLSSILWVNPTQDRDQPIEWLEQGSPDEAHRKLTAPE